MNSQPSKSSDTLQTVSRAVAVLRCFEEGAIPLTLAELTQKMGLHKVTVFRLAETLVAEGLLKKDPHKSRYTVSYGLLSLGRHLLDPDGIASAARPIAEEAQRETCETAVINILKEGSASVICEVTSPQPIKYSLGIGFSTDLRIGAAGQAILSAMQDTDIEAVLAKEPVNYVDGTTFETTELLQKIEKARRNGYCTTSGQRMREAAGYAAPFFGLNGEVLGSLAVIMPSTRNTDPAQQELFRQTVIRCAQKLSHTLGAARSAA